MKWYAAEDRTAVRILHWVTDLAAVAVLALFLALFVGKEIRMEGRSMEPVIKNGDIVLVNEICYNFREPDRLELAAAELTEGWVTVRRVVGLPGERIQIQDGAVYINGEKLAGIDPVEVPGLAASEIEIPEGYYFLLGDNTENSEDSRSEQVGLVPEEQLLGKAWFRIGGWNDMGLID